MTPRRHQREPRDDRAVRRQESQQHARLVRRVGIDEIDRRLEERRLRAFGEIARQRRDAARMRMLLILRQVVRAILIGIPARAVITGRDVRIEAELRFPVVRQTVTIAIDRIARAAAGIGRIAHLPESIHRVRRARADRADVVARAAGGIAGIDERTPLRRRVSRAIRRQNLRHRQLPRPHRRFIHIERFRRQRPRERRIGLRAAVEIVRGRGDADVVVRFRIEEAVVVRLNRPALPLHDPDGAIRHVRERVRLHRRRSHLPGDGGAHETAAQRVERVVLDARVDVVVAGDPAAVEVAADEDVVMDVGAVAGHDPLMAAFEHQVVAELVGDAADRPGAVVEHVVLDEQRRRPVELEELPLTPAAVVDVMHEVAAHRHVRGVVQLERGARRRSGRCCRRSTPRQPPSRWSSCFARSNTIGPAAT